MQTSSSRRAKVVLGPMILAGVLLVCGAALLRAQSADGDDEGRAVLAGSHADQQFISGKDVLVLASVADDIFAAGWEVLFDGASAKLIAAAGHSLRFTDTTAEDIVAAGGGFDFEGEVADDLIAAVCPICPEASHRVYLGPGAVIGDDARLAGDEVLVEGKIGGNLYAAARLVTLAGEVAGNADISAEKIVLAPGAFVGGDLTYRAESEPEIAPEATIEGETRRSGEAWFEAEHEGVLAEAIWSRVILVAGLVLLGGVLQLGLPGLLDGAAAALRRNPWMSLLMGVILLVAAPIAIGLLFVTIVGAPLAGVLVALAAVSISLALITVGAWLGRSFGGGKGGETIWARLLRTIVGLIVLGAVGAVPVVGWAVLLIASLFGLGAMVGEAWKRLRGPAALPA